MEGFSHVLDTAAIRHIFRKHGNPVAEERRGQIAVTIEDFEQLPAIVSSPDEIMFQPRGKGRTHRIVLAKRINGFVVFVEEVRQRNGHLAAVTLWKKKLAPASIATAKAASSGTSETLRRTDEVVAELSPSVNQRNAGGVDLYIGGTEHAVLHLLYARFWHKVLFDLGHLSTPEPFQRLVNQGMILGEDGRKMSKRWGNVIDPLDVIAEYGADAFRCYEMFMGPLEQMKPWSMKGVEGVSRFLARVWRLIMEENQAGEWQLSPAFQEIALEKNQLKVVHATIKKVTEDIEALSFNTAIAQMMVFVNAFTNAAAKPFEAMRTLLILLNPFAPHLTSELWKKIGAIADIARQPWPVYDEKFLIEDEVELILQVNGKLRDRVKVALNASEAELEKIALTNDRVREFAAGKEVRKVIVVPNKLVNVVAN